MKIIYWGSNVTFYQLQTIERLEKIAGESILFVLGDIENKIRMNQGWQATQMYTNEIITLKPKRFWKQVNQILTQNPSAIYLFFSFWGEKRFFLILLYALFKKNRLMIMHEAYPTRPVGYWKDEPAIISWAKVFMRRISYRFAWPIMKTLSRENPPCIFPISLLAQEQLIADGFDKNTLFPTGYFIEKKIFQKNEPTESDCELRLIYSGSLIKRKGLDIAMRGIEIVNRNNIKVQLDVYGSGNFTVFGEKRIPGITYKGRYAPEEAQSIMSQYDALIVPSRHEGWGVVVNEALLQGIPVIVSDQVGAKCLIEKSGAGIIFPSNDYNALADIIETLLNEPEKLMDLQDKASNMAKLITPEAGAKHMMDTILFYFFNQGNKPLPVWE